MSSSDRRPEEQIPYRELFEANPQPMWVYDRETRGFLMVNRAAIERYGYSREEFGRMTIDDIRPPEDVERLDETISTLSGGLAESGGWRHRTRSGEIMHVEISSHGLEFAGRPARLVQVYDVTERRAAERERRLLSTAVEAAANAVVVTDTDGVIEWVNPAFTRITGYAFAEAVGRNPRDLVRSGEHDEAFYRELWDTILSGEVWRGRVVNRRKDGRQYVADQTITPVRTEREGITHFISVHDEITDKVAFERDLRERMKELGILYETTQALYDTSVPLADRLQRVVNTLPMASLYPEITEARLSTRETVVETAGFRETPWILATGISLGGVEVGRMELVLTEERPTRDEGPFLEEERELLDSLARAVGEALERQRLDVISQEISDVIYILDTEGTVLYSTSIHPVAGYTREEFEGMSAFDVVHPDDRPRLHRLFQEMRHENGATRRVEYRVVHRNGEVRHVESVGRNLVHHPGVGGILVTTRDVTGRVEMEEAMRESQRLEAIGRLAGGVAHDFNNLLTVIRSQTDLLLEDLDGAEPWSAELEIVQDAAGRAALLTRQLLAFSRDQLLQPRVVRLCDVVRSTLDLVERVIGEDVRIEADLPGDRPTVELDPAQLEQVVLNLAVNARDAMPEGGVLRLRTFHEEIDPEAAQEEGDLQPGSYTVLEVSDTGMGMDEATRQRIFEPFFTTKGSRGGTGLGLAMAYGFVKQSGGALHARSAPGEGSTFLLRFPALDREPDAPLAADHADTAPGPSSGTVLVVEDDPSVRRVIVKILERAGLEVLTAEDAEASLDLLGSGAAVDLLLTDLGLPGMSGRRLADRVRETYPEVRVVAMSGYAPDSPGQKGDLPRDVLFLQKPFAPGVLERAVRGALESS